MLFVLILSKSQSLLGLYLKSAIYSHLDEISNNECVTQLNEIFGGNDLQQKSINNLIQYTSKNLGEMGDYRGCTEAGSRHILVNILITPTIPSTIAIGICGPINCTEEDYNKALAKPVVSILPIVTKLLDIPIKGRYWINEDSVEFFDTNKHSDNLAKVGIVAISFFILLAVFIIGGIIASFYDTVYFGRSYEESPETKVEKFILSFSIVRNMKKLTYADNPVDSNLNILNGMHTLMMLWLAASHTCFYISATPTVNILDQNFEIQNNPILQLLIMGEGPMETLLALWGFLAVATLIQIPKSEFTVFVALKLIVRHYFKFVLVYIAVLMYVIGVSPLEHPESPLAAFNKRNIDACKDYWWANLLYISNFLPSGYACIEWCAYLGLKFHLYILAVIFCYIYSKSKLFGVIIVIISCIGSITIELYLINEYDLSFTYLYNKIAQYDKFLYRFYIRIISYSIGVISAWVYFSFSSKKIGHKFPWINKLIQYFINHFWLRCINYIFALSFIVFPIYTQYFFNHYPERTLPYQNTLAIIISRPLFTLGIFMLIMPMLFGKLIAFRNISMAKCWGILTKSVFAAYTFNNFFALTERTSEMHGLYLSNSR